MFKHILDAETDLRLLDIWHSRELFELVDGQRPYLRQWLPWVDANEGINESFTFIANARKDFADSKGLQAGLWHGDRLVGVIGYHGTNWPNLSTSIGYWLSADCQGKGLMTKACRAMVHHALTELGLNRVEIRCAVLNAKSRAIPERLGFTNEGTIRDAERLYGTFVDHVVYGMLTRDWGG